MEQAPDRDRLNRSDTARKSAVTNRPELAEPSSRKARFRQVMHLYVPSSRMGIAFAAVMFVISMSPSLLPRSWWWQGVVSGILIQAGYATGAFAGWLISRLRDKAQVQVSAKRSWERGSKWVLAVAVAAWAIWMLVRSYKSNNAAAKLMDLPAMTFLDYMLAGATAAVIVAAIAGLVFLTINLWRRVDGLAVKVMPRWVAALISTIVVVSLATFVLSDVLFERGMEYTYRTFAQSDQSAEPGVVQPTEPERSGSIHSKESWNNLGKYGKSFVASGPRARQIEAVTGRPAMEPIRIYAGLTKGRSLEQGAQMVVAELHRSGALNRSVIVIATTTGTGWVEEWAVQPVEYLTGGDVATVATQYSYVPSAIAFLREFDLPATASKILYEAVVDEVAKLPASQRPAVYVQGVSLGAYGSQSVFEDEAHLLRSVDGAVWAGTPNATQLWQDLTGSRHLGSPMVAPVVSSGHNIRFATKPEDLRADIYGRDLPQWSYPRVAVLQHATDPVVWWNSGLIGREPQWLQEPARTDLNPDMQWTRFATFIQVSADLPVAGLTADGHGHVYHREFIPVWAQVLGLVNEGEMASYTGKNPYDEADDSWFDDEVSQKIAQAISTDLYG